MSTHPHYSCPLKCFFKCLKQVNLFITQILNLAVSVIILQLVYMNKLIL